MGWTEKMVNGYTKKNTKELVRQQINPNFKILKDSVRGNVYYGACQEKETGITHGLVVLTRWRPGNTFGCLFGTKFITESMGPVESNCPKSILLLLSPTENENAIAWRTRCLMNHEERLRWNRVHDRLRKLEHGTMIQFINHRDLNCSNPGESVTLRKISYLNGKNGNRNDIWTDGRYRWKEKYIPEDFNVCGVC